MLSTFGRRLRLLREDAQLTQEQLRAEMERRCQVAVGGSYISELERTGRMPSLEVAKAMAVVLKTSTDYLAMLTDDHAPADSRQEPEARYISPEADEVASLLDSLRAAQRQGILAAVRSLVQTATPAQDRDGADVMLDVIDQELGGNARAQIERALKRRRVAAAEK